MTQFSLGIGRANLGKVIKFECQWAKKKKNVKGESVIDNLVVIKREAEEIFEELFKEKNVTI